MKRWKIPMPDGRTCCFQSADDVDREEAVAYARQAWEGQRMQELQAPPKAAPDVEVSDSDGATGGAFAKLQ